MKQKLPANESAYECAGDSDEQERGCDHPDVAKLYGWLFDRGLAHRHAILTPVESSQDEERNAA